MNPEAGSNESESPEPEHAPQSDPLERDGYQLIRGVLSAAECDALAQQLSPVLDEKMGAAKSRIGGVRNLLHTQECVRRLAFSNTLTALLRRPSGRTPFPVRAIFFDKTTEANWRVPWHQDVAIAVERRIDTVGFEGWSIKEGVTHVIPPSAVLANMTAVRIHLDNCDASNGALKIIPGSHTAGRLNPEDEQRWIASGVPVVCSAAKGDALVMKPLVLHASASAETPEHRRVLHIEYACQDLPNGLTWFEQIDRSATADLAFIALGSNLGDSRAILQNAMARLQELSAKPILTSSVRETEPEDCPPGSPRFLNAAVALWPFPGETPETLLAKLQALEKEFGRRSKTVLNEARPLDLDLIAFGLQTRATPQLKLPHPRAHRRQFVLQPLADIAPDLKLPGQTRTVSELSRETAP